MNTIIDFTFTNAGSIENVKKLIENFYADLINNYKEMMTDMQTSDLELYTKVQDALVSDDFNRELFDERLANTFSVRWTNEFKVKAKEYYSKLAEKYKLDLNDGIMLSEYEFRFFDLDIERERDNDLSILDYSLHGNEVVIQCNTRKTQSGIVTMLMRLEDYFIIGE